MDWASFITHLIREAAGSTAYLFLAPGFTLVRRAPGGSPGAALGAASRFPRGRRA